MAHPGPPFTGDRRRRPWLTQACRSREIDTAVRHSPKPAVHGRSAPPSSAAHPSPRSWEIDVPVSPERPQLPTLPERPQVPDRASTSPKEICSAPTKEAGAGAEADSTWLPESLLLPWSPSPRIYHGRPSTLLHRGSRNGRRPGGLLSCFHVP